MFLAYKLNKQSDNTQPWHTPFPIVNQFYCSMSNFNCCFLTYIQFSQETDKVVWYSHILKNFPFCHDPQSQRFCIVNEAEVDVFWNLLAFSIIQWMLAIWSLVPLSFLNTAWTSGTSWFTYCWSLPWRILSITLRASEMSEIVLSFEHSLLICIFLLPLLKNSFEFVFLGSFFFSFSFVLLWFDD